MANNQDYSRYFEGLYNISGFDGTIESDFLKLGQVPDDRKPDLIDYNINGFDQYRTALQNYLRSVYPLDYNNFAASDLGQMLLEMFAYMASVLALRTDMTANEMYIDTVKNEDNLKRLLELIGVSMKGPTASKATGLLTFPDDVTPTADVIIPERNRTVQVINERSNVALSYTVTRQFTNGDLDLFSKDLTIPLSDFNGTKYVSSLFLLEGALKTQNGTFRGGQKTRQTFEITDGPVIEGSIGLSSTEAGGTQYNEITNLFLASGGTQPVFEKTYTGGYGCILTFGDGVRGRLPTPGANFVVTYRTGGGGNGNIARGSLNTTVNCLNNTNVPVEATLENTTKGSGGTAAESVAHAKRYAPYFFRTQYRAVTGEDYNTLANSFVGTAGTTAKCMASLRTNGAAANVIDLFVLSKASDTQLERASVAMKKELLDYFKNYKMLTDDIVISDGVVRTLDIVATLYIDKSNKRFIDSIQQKAADKLLEYFNVDNLAFGQKISMSDVNNFMLTVPEIRFFKVDNLPEDIYVNFNEIVQLNNFEFSTELV
mgnify:FL=1|tara:strand:+ start:1550 stop:3178 length:1629 start_codon:yes stop_codon:yes gene_type:complete